MNGPGRGKSDNIRCRNYYPDGTERGRGCKLGSKCKFLHPEDSNWKRGWYWKHIQAELEAEQGSGARSIVTPLPLGGSSSSYHKNPNPHGRTAADNGWGPSTSTSSTDAADNSWGGGGGDNGWGSRKTSKGDKDTSAGWGGGGWGGNDTSGGWGNSDTSGGLGNNDTSGGWGSNDTASGWGAPTNDSASGSGGGWGGGGGGGWGDSTATGGGWGSPDPSAPAWGSSNTNSNSGWGNDINNDGKDASGGWGSFNNDAQTSAWGSKNDTTSDKSKGNQRTSVAFPFKSRRPSPPSPPRIDTRLPQQQQNQDPRSTTASPLLTPQAAHKDFKESPALPALPSPTFRAASPNAFGSASPFDLADLDREAETTPGLSPALTRGRSTSLKREDDESVDGDRDEGGGGGDDDILPDIGLGPSLSSKSRTKRSLERKSCVTMPAAPSVPTAPAGPPGPPPGLGPEDVRAMEGSVLRGKMLRTLIDTLTTTHNTEHTLQPAYQTANEISKAPVYADLKFDFASETVKANAAPLPLPGTGLDPAYELSAFSRAEHKKYADSKRAGEKSLAGVVELVGEMRLREGVWSSSRPTLQSKSNPLTASTAPPSLSAPATEGTAVDHPISKAEEEEEDSAGESGENDDVWTYADDVAEYITTTFTSLEQHLISLETHTAQLKSHEAALAAEAAALAVSPAQAQASSHNTDASDSTRPMRPPPKTIKELRRRIREVEMELMEVREMVEEERADKDEFLEEVREEVVLCAEMKERKDGLREEERARRRREVQVQVRQQVEGEAGTSQSKSEEQREDGELDSTKAVDGESLAGGEPTTSIAPSKEPGEASPIASHPPSIPPPTVDAAEPTVPTPPPNPEDDPFWGLHGDEGEGDTWYSLPRMNKELAKANTKLEQISQGVAIGIQGVSDREVELVRLRTVVGVLGGQKDQLQEWLREELQLLSSLIDTKTQLTQQIQQLLSQRPPSPPPSPPPSSTSSTHPHPYTHPHAHLLVPPTYDQLEPYIEALIKSEFDALVPKLADLRDEVRTGSENSRDVLYADVWRHLQGGLKIADGVKTWADGVRPERGGPGASVHTMNGVSGVNGAGGVLRAKVGQMKGGVAQV